MLFYFKRPTAECLTQVFNHRRKHGCGQGRSVRCADIGNCPGMPQASSIGFVVDGGVEAIRSGGYFAVAPARIENPTPVTVIKI